MNDIIFPKPTGTALLVVDVQERFVPAIGEEAIDGLTRGILTLCEVARELDWPLVYSEQYPKGLGPTVSRLSERLDELGAARFEKTHFSCCREEVFATGIQPSLPNHIIVTGIETHVCVLQTVADLQARGHQCFVPYDTVASRAEANRENGLELIRRVGGVVTNVESLLFAALGKAGTPAFKRLSKLIR